MMNKHVLNSFSLECGLLFICSSLFHVTLMAEAKQPPDVTRTFENVLHSCFLKPQCTWQSVLYNQML